MAAVVLTVIGGVFLAYHGLRFLSQLYNGLRSFVLPSLGMKKDLKQYGSWAVVTGCTDGIGKAYAEQLAAKGINIVLISRSPEKLKLVDDELKSQYSVDTRVIAKDFSGGSEIYDDLEEQLNDLDIGILVNNVGVAQNPDYFADYNREDCWKMVNVNALSAVMMSHIVIPGMVSRKRGVVVNIASLIGSDPMPLMSVYCATKAFIDFFSRCLHAEYSSKGIFVQVVMPAFVATKMISVKERNGSFFTPCADTFTNQALGTIGIEQRTCGYWVHSLKAWICFTFIPAWLRLKIWWKLWGSVREFIQKMQRRKRDQRAKQEHHD